MLAEPRDVRAHRAARRMWLYPVLAIVAFTLALFGGIYWLDFLVFGLEPSPDTGPLSHYVHFDPGLITDALPALGMTNVAVLGIILTVVAIIVQLSSDRYSGVARMFMQDGINIAVLSYFVVVSIFTVWLSVSLQEGFVPRASLMAAMIGTVIGLSLMLPYFAYLFWFLEPANIIDRIRSQAARGALHGARSDSETQIEAQQRQVLSSMEEITDIANNSIHGRDKIICSRAVDALRDFVLHYLESKPEHEHAWFKVSGGIAGNPDFVAMDTELVQDLESSRLWVEWKVLRQYLTIYNDAMASMQDITYLLAINARYIGEAAAKRSNLELVRMVLRFMNSYLRVSINARNMRVAYNVLHQYRMLLESLLRLNQSEALLAGTSQLKYYGHLAFDVNLTFLTETLAHDMATLCQYAHESGAPEESQLLDQFLDLDRPTHGYRQERGLRGVRKAQAKLAAYYLASGGEERARLIAADMRSEPSELLRSIHDDLARTTSKQFWENVDRGGNFDYLPPEHRAELGRFFSLLDTETTAGRGATER